MVASCLAWVKHSWNSTTGISWWGSTQRERCIVNSEAIQYFPRNVAKITVNLVVTYTICICKTLFSICTWINHSHSTAIALCAIDLALRSGVVLICTCICIKHLYKVHVWAGISLKGRTGLWIFTGTIARLVYMEILQKTLIPFVAEVYPISDRFMAGNDPNRTSIAAQDFLLITALIGGAHQHSLPISTQLRIYGMILKHGFREKSSHNVRRNLFMESNSSGRQ